MNYKRSLKKLKRYHYNWLNIIFLIILFPLALLLSITCAIVFFSYLFEYPRKGYFKGVLFNTYEHLIYDLDKKNIKNFNLKKEQIEEFTIGDSEKSISALMVKNGNSKKWIIGLHGFKRNKYMGLRGIYHLYEKGYNLLCFDAYAHGSTYGTYSDFGLTNSEVLNEVIKWTKNSFEIEEIGVFGTSMGATSSLFFAKRFYNENKIDWLVVDCPFSQAVPQIRFFLQKKLFLPWWLMSLGVNYNFRKYAKSDIQEVDLIYDYENLKDLKTLFIHGKKDDVTMYANTVVLYNLKIKSESGQLSEIKIYDNAEHSSSMHKNLEDYVGTTINFIKKTF